MYEVTLYVSKATLPLSFCVHGFIVVRHKDTINRFEVLDPRFKESNPSNYQGRIFKNFFSDDEGLLISPLPTKWNTHGSWDSKKIVSITGGEDSVASKIYKFIQEQDGLKQYPYCHSYNMVLGPNSNTFMQWLIKQFPEIDWKLPWNAWGKGYRITPK